jgi:hypothetical protein
MKSAIFLDPSSFALRGRMRGAVFEEWWERSTVDSRAEVARLTGIRGWLLWKIITLWISFAVFGLVAFGARAQNFRQASVVCFFYAVFAGITAFMLQAKKPGALLVAAMFSLLSGSIPWIIYFAVSRRVEYTYAASESTRQNHGDVLIRLLTTVHESEAEVK